MAILYNINLGITSIVGFRRPSSQTGSFDAPKPITTTTFTLNGVSIPATGLGDIKNISVGAVADFVTYPKGYSNTQTVQITNIGNQPVTLISPFYKKSAQGAGASISVVSSEFPNFPIIQVGQTGTFRLSYYGGPLNGTYTNFVIIVSDADVGQYKLLTTQTVSDLAAFSLSAYSFIRSVTSIGQIESYTYELTPLVNNVAKPNIVFPFTANITGSRAWRITDKGNNYVTVEFDANEIDNINGTYAATLLINSVPVSNSATVNIDYSKNKNFGSWHSAISPYNSFVAMSYDLVDDNRVLTIGAGFGGDGSPTYNEAMELYSNILEDGVVRGYLNRGSYLSEICKITLDGTSRTYYSANYLTRTTDLDYGSYFGNNQSLGSMFVIQDDGYGNLTVNMNRVSKTAATESTNQTLQNLSRAFFYYSAADTPARYTQLGSPKGDGSETDMFIGFNNQGDVETALVPYPT